MSPACPAPASPPVPTEISRGTAPSRGALAVSSWCTSQSVYFYVCAVCRISVSGSMMRWLCSPHAASPLSGCRPLTDDTLRPGRVAGRRTSIYVLHPSAGRSPLRYVTRPSPSFGRQPACLARTRWSTRVRQRESACELSIVSACRLRAARRRHQAHRRRANRSLSPRIQSCSRSCSPCASGALARHERQVNTG